MTPILVTGGTGYLGSAAISVLENLGKPCLSVGTSEPADLVCDLTDRRQCRELATAHSDAVLIHCAAKVPRCAAEYEDSDLAAQSLAMVKNLVDGRFRHLVFISSMSVYPDGIGVARESDARATGRAYADAKLAAERVVMDASGCLATVLRLPGLFGEPRQKGLLFNVARSFAYGKDFSLSERLPQWAALHVEDAADICVRAAVSPPRQSIILNAGYPDAMSIPDAVQRLARLFGMTSTVSDAPLFRFELSRLVGALGPVAGDYQSRLEQLADLARRQAANDQS